MRIVCAPDSFKETLDARAVAEAMADGARAAGVTDIVVCPVADGGEGTADALAPDGVRHFEEVADPLGRPIRAAWMETAHGSAIVEIASASGLARLNASERNPIMTSSFGTGRLIAAAVRAGHARIVVGLGGSATCDGGLGLAQALGAIVHRRDGSVMTVPVTGGDLVDVGSVTSPTDPPMLTALADVTHPLTGPGGAAAVFGPQKGAGPDDVARLDAGLRNLAECVGVDPDQPGFGAAGGAGFGLAALCGAALVPGAPFILEQLHFADACRGADIVFTGEGRIDGTSAAGKAPGAVARIAGAAGAFVVAVVGNAGPDADRALVSAGGSIHAIIDLTAQFGADTARRDPAGCIRASVASFLRERGQD